MGAIKKEIPAFAGETPPEGRKTVSGPPRNEIIAAMLNAGAALAEQQADKHDKHSVDDAPLSHSVDTGGPNRNEQASKVPTLQVTSGYKNPGEDPHANVPAGQQRRYIADFSSETGWGYYQQNNLNNASSEADQPGHNWI